MIGEGLFESREESREGSRPGGGSIDCVSKELTRRVRRGRVV